MTLSPLDLYEIGEAVSEALPEPRVTWADEKGDEGGPPIAYLPEEPHGQLGERVLSELQRRGWRLVREGERDG